jgi:hypothetical protein
VEQEQLEEEDDFQKDSSKASVSKKGSLKDDAAYDEPVVATLRPGAFHATGAPRTKEEKLAAAGEDEPVYIEVFPGVSERLRRTMETKEAVENDFITPAVCFACDTEIYCIADVKYYICPTCKCVSLLSESKHSRERKDVGIAFGLETLFKMRSEIARQK